MSDPLTTPVSGTTDAWHLLGGWVTGPVGTSMGILVGILGVALAVYFYYKQKRECKPVFVVSTSVIIDHKRTLDSGAPSRLKVLWDDSLINQLAVSEVQLGNVGKEPIRGADLPKHLPTFIGVRDGEILASSILYQSSPGLSPILVARDASTLEVSFDYLDYGDVFVVRIMHTGGWDSVEVQGHVIGAGTWRSPRVSYPGAGLANLLVMSVCAVAAGVGSSMYSLSFISFLVVLAAVAFSSFGFSLAAQSLVNRLDETKKLRLPTKPARAAKPKRGLLRG